MVTRKALLLTVVFAIMAGCTHVPQPAMGLSASKSMGVAQTTEPTQAQSLSPTPTETPTPTPSPSPTLTAMPTPSDIWFQLVLRTPIPWTTPQPPEERTPLDDTYAKFDPSEREWWICRRCPDYLPAGGNWRLQFDKGVYRIYYDVIQWRSLGSYVVSGDRIYLFNDPYCQWEVGEYRWKLENRQLTFEVIEDPCSFKLRAANLTSMPWTSCQPPNREAAISDHWIKPAGCVQ